MTSQKEAEVRSPPTLRKRVLAAGAWVLALQIATKASTLLFTVIATRELGLSFFAQLALMQSAAILAMAVWDAGYSGALVPEVAAGRVDSRQALKDSFRQRLLCFPALVAVWSLAGFVGPLASNSAGVLALGLLLATTSGVSVLLISSINSMLSFKHSAIGGGIARLLPVAILIIDAAVSTPTVASALLALIIGEISATCFYLINLRRIFRAIDPGSRGGLAWRIVRPYAVNSIAQTAYNRADVLAVGAFGGALTAGLYAPASRIQDVMALLPAILSAVLIPIMADSLRSPTGGQIVRAVVQRAVIVGVAIALPVAIVVSIFAPTITKLLGEDFAGSTDAIRIIVFSGVIVAIAAPIFDSAVARGNVQALNFSFLVALAYSVLGYALVTPFYGANGAAVVAVSRDLVGLIAAGAALAWLRPRRESDQRAIVTSPNQGIDRSSSTTLPDETEVSGPK